MNPDELQELVWVLFSFFLHPCHVIHTQIAVLSTVPLLSTQMSPKRLSGSLFCFIHPTSASPI
jgi:hypothetical protein